MTNYQYNRKVHILHYIGLERLYNTSHINVSNEYLVLFRSFAFTFAKECIVSFI